MSLLIVVADLCAIYLAFHCVPIQTSFNGTMKYSKLIPVSSFDEQQVAEKESRVCLTIRETETNTATTLDEK